MTIKKRKFDFPAMIIQSSDIALRVLGLRFGGFEQLGYSGNRTSKMCISYYIILYIEGYESIEKRIFCSKY